MTSTYNNKNNNSMPLSSNQQDRFHDLDLISQQQKPTSSVLLEVLPERDASKC